MVQHSSSEIESTLVEAADLPGKTCGLPVAAGAVADGEALINALSVRHQPSLPTYAEERELVEFQDEGRIFHLHRSAMGKWQAMKAAAAADGIHLHLVSAFRSIERQNAIIENKRAKGIPDEEIFRASAPPGHSEHHTGRAIDINNPGCPALEEEFDNTPAFQWLMQHAADFGFHLSYPRNNPFGIAYEPWHWRCHE